MRYFVSLYELRGKLEPVLQKFWFKLLPFKNFLSTQQILKHNFKEDIDAPNLDFRRFRLAPSS